MSYKCIQGHFTDKEHENKNCPYDSKSKFDKLIDKYSDNPSEEKKKYIPPLINIVIPEIKISKEKNNIYPNLKERSLIEMGVKENKKVLLKPDIILRNLKEHPDVSIGDFEEIISNTLYLHDDIIKGKNKDKNYYSFIKVIKFSKRNGKPIYGTCLLDVEPNNEYFEIVHCHFVKEKNLNSLK